MTDRITKLVNNYFATSKDHSQTFKNDVIYEVERLVNPTSTNKEIKEALSMIQMELEEFELDN